MECIYCGKEITGKNKSNEHVIPQWIQNHLQSNKQAVRIEGISKKNIKVFDSTPTLNKLQFKICVNCNNGWLSKIDSSCNNLLISLMNNNYPLYLFYEILQKRRAEFFDLYTLLYKIFLNYYAASPFRQNYNQYFTQFFTVKKAPNYIRFFYCGLKDFEKVAISHSDFWEGKSQFGLTDSIQREIMRFKFYLKIGNACFVICSPGSLKNKIIYNPNYLFPINNNFKDIKANIGLKHPIIGGDLISNRILTSILILTP